jgi:hypothetical protein
MTIVAATARRLQADKDLANRRVELIAAQNAEREARATLAQAVGAFQAGFSPMTPEQLRRQHVQEQAGIREAIREGRMAPRRPTFGKSRVDASAYYQRGGSPGGGGRAYSRGAFPASARGRTVKVPSEI